MELVKAFNDNELTHLIKIKGTHEEPLFRLSDIGIILDLVNPRQSVKDFDETEKILISDTTDGGQQNVIYITEDGLYQLLFISRKPIVKKFKKWVSSIIKEVRLNGVYKLENDIRAKEEIIESQQQSLMKQSEIIQKQNEEINFLETSKIPTIYIYNCDATVTGVPSLKIGFTDSVNNRTKNFKQTHKYGKMEYYVGLVDFNIRKIEQFIHEALSFYRVRDEIFNLHVQDAIMYISTIVNLLKFMKTPDDPSKLIKMSKVYESTELHFNNHPLNVTTCNAETQTQMEIIEELRNENNSNKNDDNIDNDIIEFIAEKCTVHKDAIVKSKIIVGEFRMWHKIKYGGKSEKKNTDKIMTYLKTNFLYGRTTARDADGQNNAFFGITVNEAKIEKSICGNITEDFILQCCTFGTEHRVLMTDLVEEYTDWKTRSNMNVTNEEKDEIVTYFRTYNTHLVSRDTVWASGGSGQGYYGLILNKHLKITKNTSSTGKKVKKIDATTGAVLNRWDTIASASRAENISTATLSRAIKNQKHMNGIYYTND